MKALTFSQHGTLENIQLSDQPTPDISPDDVLLEVKAAALNRLDLWVLEGWPSLKLHLPHIMGSDGAGIIAQVGRNVSDFEVGDHVAVNPTLSCGRCAYCISGRDNMCDQMAVLGEHAPGFYCEYQKVPARNLLKMPDGASFEDAAAAALVYVTAWHSLIKRGQFQAGESILIVGAGGGVNTASIQIAKLAGAGTIYVIGSTDDKLEQAAELCADVLINRKQQDWGKAIYKATHKRGVDVVVDNVGAATYHTSFRSLKKGGRLITVGNTSGAKFEIDNRLIFGKQISIIGSTMGPKQDFDEVMGLVFSGRLQPVIDTIYPLTEGLTALHRLRDSEMSGKLVLTP